MSKQEFSRLHRRLAGLAAVIEMKLAEADIPGKPMSKRERADLAFILSQLEAMLKDDSRETWKKSVQRELMKQSEEKSVHSELNTGCEFFDLDANRIQCAIGCDMFHCSKNCCYATNVPGSMPPYCTKYMKGWIAF